MAVKFKSWAAIARCVEKQQCSFAIPLYLHMYNLNDLMRVPAC